MYIVCYHVEETNRGIVYMAQETLELPQVMVENSAIVSSIPNPEMIPQKSPQLNINIETKEMWYEYLDRPLTKEEELQKQIDELKAMILAMQA